MQQAADEMLGLATDQADSDLTVGSSDIGLSQELSMMMESPPHMPLASASHPASVYELSPTQQLDHQHAPVSPAQPAIIHTAAELSSPEGQAQLKRTKFDDHVQKIEIQTTQDVPSQEQPPSSSLKPIRSGLRGAHHDSHPYNPKPSSSEHYRALSDRLGGTAVSRDSLQYRTYSPGKYTNQISKS